MKAVEGHAADLYLLANDILQNQFAQQHRYKSRFYYAFNPTLPYQQTDSGHISQLKLLYQLQDKGVIDFEVKPITAKTPQEMISKNALTFGGETMLLRINPYGLGKLLSQMRKYGRRVQTTQKRAVQSARLEGSVLAVSGFTIPLKSKNGKYLLQGLLQDRASRKDVWAHEDLMRFLEPSPSLKEPANLVRDTANNINRRVADATGGAIPKLLQVKVDTVQLDPKFV